MENMFLQRINLNYEFGNLLSIDFNQCYDTENVLNLDDYIIKEIKDDIQDRGFPDYFWFKGIGSSLKYSRCKKIIENIKDIYPHQKVGMYLNCELFQEKKLINDFYGFDFIAINLNSIDPIDFSKINKCSNTVNSFDVLKGIKEFRNGFEGNLGIYTLFLRGINDNVKTLEYLKNFLLEIIPDHYSVSNYTLDGFKPISEKFKNKVREMFKDLPFKVIFMF